MKTYDVHLGCSVLRCYLRCWIMKVTTFIKDTVLYGVDGDLQITLQRSSVFDIVGL